LCRLPGHRAQADALVGCRGAAPSNARGTDHRHRRGRRPEQARPRLIPVDEVGQGPSLITTGRANVRSYRALSTASRDHGSRRWRRFRDIVPDVGRLWAGIGVVEPGGWRRAGAGKVGGAWWLYPVRPMTRAP